MSDGKITFANIVSTPSDTSWSQAYTAGKLYAVLSLEEEDSNTAHLAAAGKEIINALVEEFFTLETKDLTTIKAALAQTVHKIPKKMRACLVVISLVNNILYAFAYGGGKVMLKRGEKLGTILQPKDDEMSIHAVSGFLQNADLLIVQTKQFADSIPTDDLTSFTTPADAVELLSPKIHGKDAGGAAAIILSYAQEPVSAIAADTETAHAVQPSWEEEKEEEDVPSALEDEVAHRELPKQSFAFPKIHIPLPKFSFKLKRKTLLFLSIPLFLLIILTFSIYTTKKNQENAKVQQLFNTVYPAAQKKYDEGVALVSLNEELAQDYFREAKMVLEKHKKSFPADSEQEQKMQALLKKVTAAIEEDSPALLTSSETESTNSPLLSALLKNKAAFATASNTTVYTGSNTAVQTAEGKTVIANDGDWKTIGGLGAFGTNIYVLDKSGNQILKFLGGSADSMSVYATGSFDKATAMAIDSSIYVLNADGSIKKFTRGAADTFGITGLETPLKKPTRIFTDATTDSVYVLDPASARIVALSKTGAWQKTYSATIIKDAKDFDVHEKEKKIYILANNKVYEIKIP